MSEPMTLEETIAALDKMLPHYRTRAEESARHWLTTLKAERTVYEERIGVYIETVAELAGQKKHLGEQVAKLREALAHVLCALEDTDDMDEDFCEPYLALLKETEPAE